MTRPKLLLADDSVTIRKVVELTFADEGVDVTAVANGEQAMEKFIEIQPDIVLVDVNMPDPTGYHICEMIKQDDMTRHIPVILLVGSFEPFDQDEAERVGADGFLTKPFRSIRDLVAKVDELLKPESEPAEVLVATALDVNEALNAQSESAEVTGETAVSVDEALNAESELSDDDSVDEPRGEEGQLDEVTLEMGDNVDELLGPEVGSDEVIDETGDIDSLYDRSFAATTRMTGEESSEILLGDPGLDDEIIETSHPTGDKNLGGGKTMRGFDWSAEPATEPGATAGNGEVESVSGTGEEEEVFDIDHNANIDTLRDMETISLLADGAAPAEPSEEFIALVVRRVVEKLSDKVIREIAQEAVPRIAEGLIREALDDESKNKD